MRRRAALSALVLALVGLTVWAYAGGSGDSGGSAPVDGSGARGDPAHAGAVAPVAVDTAEARSADGARAAAPDDPSAEADPGATARAALPLAPVGVGGIVLDPSGAPVPDTIVALFFAAEDNEIQPPFAVTSGADGRFRVGPRSLSSAQIIAHHDDYPPCYQTLSEAQLRGLEPIEVRFVEGVSFSGRVLDEDGMPVATADLKIRESADTRPAFEDAEDPVEFFGPKALRHKTGKVTTDRDGNFTCRGWPQGRSLRLEVVSGRIREFEPMRVSTGAIVDRKSFEIAAEPGAHVTLFVRVKRAVGIKVRGDGSAIAPEQRRAVRLALEDGSGRRRIRLGWNDARFWGKVVVKVPSRHTLRFDLVFTDARGLEQRFGPYLIEGTTVIEDLVLR